MEKLDSLNAILHLKRANIYYLETSRLPWAGVDRIDEFVATQRQRRSTKGAGSARRAEAMTGKLLKQSASKWKSTCGYDDMPQPLSHALDKNREVLDVAVNQQGI